ncbi:MAG: Hydroxymyristoyl-ACP dehydratase [uncultured Aureispira sp.]|uniref:Hydroxymyristoyl-ACP dehydratase n=1 Tax=uncultured Aureispira sp. TaxID=1331704 RepID=A0A6S6THU9_9BACT|nr:MAG: Hydroxymyristoyl-ACP dehydratase [uncultured Aureispira sp.]
MDNTNPPTKPLVTGNAVLQMIPQKPPMAMIDTIIAVTAQKARTALTITKENIFCDEGFFQAPGLSENIAQTAAAQVGYLSHLAGEAPPVGFIGAIKNLNIEQLPEVGDQLITEIEIEHEIMNFTVINGISKVGDQVMAKCQMKIFIADTEQA